MRSPIYDDQLPKTDDSHAPDLNKITGIGKGEEDQMDAAASDGARQDLAGREQDATASGPANTGSESNRAGSGKDASDGQSGQSLYKPEPSAKSENSSRFKSAKSKLSRLAKNKWLLAAGVGGGVTAGGAIFMLIFFLGLLKTPQLAEHIAAYQFARVTRDYALRAQNVNGTKIALDSAEQSTWEKMKVKYTASPAGQAQAKVAEKWSKLDKYRPQKTIDNMRNSGEITYNYDKSPILGRQRLQSIKVGSTLVEIENLSLKQKFIPGYQFYKNIQFSGKFRSALSDSTGLRNVNALVRGLGMRSLRQELGISLIAWHLDKLKGKTPAEARVIVAQETYNNVDKPLNPSNPAAAESTRRLAEDAKAAERASVADPKQMQNIIDHPNEPVPSVLNVLKTAFQESAAASAFKTFLGFINPIYAIAAPVCMVYEGSLQNNGSTINQADNSSQRAFVVVQAAASQQKDGYEANGQAVGAFSAQLGNIEDTNPERRANGLPVDTTKSVSSQSAPSGQFSIADAILPAPLDTIFNDAAATCPIFTNIWAGIGLGVVNIAATFFSGGLAAGGEAAADVAALTGIRAVVIPIVQKVISSGAFLKSFGKSVVIQGSAVYLATKLAQWVVVSQMGAAQTSPLAVGKPFVHNADAGGNSHASATERTLLRGAPLTQQEVATNNMMDTAFRAENVSHQGTYERYLAISNPDSLLNKIGSSIRGVVDGTGFASVINLAGTALNPAHSMGVMVGALNTSKVMAANTDTFNYGNIQFGFTNEERHIMTTDLTYTDVLENQRLLDASNKEEEISKRFGPCYDKATGVGTLMTEKTGESGANKYFIVRDKAGNVSADQGLCSQRMVGPHNNEYGDGMVFRWRVAGGYDAALTQLDEEQNPTKTDSPVQSTGPPTPSPATDSSTVVIGDTSNLTCSAGTDGGIVDGYANQILYKTRVCTVQNLLISAQIAGNVDKLLNAAKTAGIPLTGGSGFRTMVEQQFLYNCYITKSCNGGNLAAVPGTSNHQMGLAVDFHCNGPRTIVSGDICFNWMQTNAANFGLKNLPSEAWHWSYNGT